MKKNTAFKEFKYPDGRVLRLTEKEFYQIVDAFRILINSKRKQEGKPPLQGPKEPYVKEDEEEYVPPAPRKRL